ncbi:MAG: serine/threonine-protein kinase, partial [Acidobacteria bacterium]|nr:serine/threonine-protein kinase [Acidobacteriota bacterium]
ASLLRRFGRLPEYKAVEISRQLCAALAAAHDEGVLHRDLKPANIMLDGRGRVKLTDFGLAAVAEVRAGTPIYMAPEQLAGEEVSVRSDLYALGLVLHELFTGKRVFEAGDLEELKRQHEHSMTRSLTTTSELDPAVDRVIQRCLKPDPNDRPRSALVVAAGLPGADPLAAALAAGETPSPEMVAEAGGEGKLRPAIAIPVLALAVLGALVFTLLNARFSIVNWIPFDTPPQVLDARAQEIVAELGYDEPPVDGASGFAMSLAYPDWLSENEAPPERYETLREGRPAVGRFWWRSSPEPMLPHSRVGDAQGVVTPSEPPVDVPGMLLLRLDLRGRLFFLEAVPETVVDLGRDGDGMEWDILFAAAGLEMADFQPVEPRRTPSRYADERMAWEGVFPEDEEVALRIEAAAFQGRPVMWRYFSTFAPLEPSAGTGTGFTFGQAVGIGVVVMVVLGVIGGAVFLARRNVRLGRGDRRAASRLATFLTLTLMAVWVLRGTHVADFGQVGQFVNALTWAVALGGLTWALYLAVEPIMRRHDPERLIGWSRLIDGRLGDPLVGRDLLFGCGVGAVAAIFFLLAHATAQGDFSRPAWDPHSLESLAGPGGFIASELVGLPAFASLGLGFLLLYAVALALFRRRWVAMAVLVGLVGFISAGDHVSGSPWGFGFLMAGWILSLGVLARLGVLAFVVTGWTAAAFNTYFVTLDFSVWYAPNVLLGMGMFLGIACYGFYRSVEWKSDVAERWLDS